MRDLDLNREGFEEEALKLPIKEFSRVLKSDDLKCRSEDQVLNLTLAYIERVQKQIYEETRALLMPLIKVDLLTKEKLVELSTSHGNLIKGMENKIIDALCSKLQGGATIE